MADSAPARVLTPEEEELKKLIHQLRPDSDVYSGRLFFERLLENCGAEKTKSFIHKASKAMDDWGELDLHLNFDKVEREIFGKTRMQFWSQKGIFGVGAAGYSGLAFATYGALSIAGQASRFVREGHPFPKKQPDKENTPAFTQLAKRFQDTIGPTAELAIGGALMHEAHENWVNARLEQVGDAIEKLVEAVPELARMRA
ncbi:MAG: hypothetical protein WDN72_03880 [Alphaproteobacteria bacterium]